MAYFFLTTLLLLVSVIAIALFIGYVMVPVFRGIGAFITALFNGIGWFFSHIFEFLGGVISDALRCIGAMLAMVVLAVLAIVNVIIGRWSAAGHFADSVKREFMVVTTCLYRVLIRRPLKLLLVDGLLEGLEQRVPEAVYATPRTDAPRNRLTQFQGYTIVGTLPGGGSGGKLYIARPDKARRASLGIADEHVVIKSFAISEGSTLPQIVRESRALECAKQLGHVLDHGMDDHRFFYVMPYHAGDHLGIITRQLHGEAGGELDGRALSQLMGYITDLLATLSRYHQGGFWHKDVKPENVIVHDGRAHLVDLGLITPLQSAMTLTTHGTEYFRDPEMVRQALRGVKVHQVNGAKFDIYAVGAVLYFMLENTFPAHGGLSRFSKKSPEALRWIVRRSMADYNQRYEDAGLMLADVTAVAQAADPFAFKPADLPSMKAGDSRTDDFDADAASDTIPPLPPYVASTPLPRHDDRHLNQPRIAHAAASAHSAAPQRPNAMRRPLLRITNWWTGAYAVDDDGLEHRAVPAVVPVARTPVSPRRSAQEQLHAAQVRVAEARRRAETRRRKVGLERQPSAALGFIVVVFLVAVALIALVVLNGRSPMQQVASSHTPAAHPSTDASEPVDHGRPVLLLLDIDPTDTRRAIAAQAVVKQYQARGYHVIDNIGLADSQVRDLYHAWENSRSDALATELEDALAEHDLYGLLHIKVLPGDSLRVSETLIRSQRKDAEHRRRPDDAAAAINPTPALPFILINDHPARADQHVAARIREVVDGYRARGWNITIDDDTETEIRKILPPAITADWQTTPRLMQLLEQHELSGILHISAQPGEAAPYQRVQALEIHAPPDTAAIEPASGDP